MTENPLKILIADDQRDLVTSLSRILQMRGFEVATAYDGKEAVETYLSWRPDAVIMDVRMPHQDGIDACLEMLQAARTRLLVILMTGFTEALAEAEKAVLAQAGRRGRVKVMMKPLNLDQVMELLAAEEGGSTKKDHVS